MPELKPLPCPHCLGANTRPIFDEDGEYFVLCRACGMRGPAVRYMFPAIREWNALPRTLTWTTEPPKVAGWYPWRWAKYQNWMCLEVRDGLIVEHPRNVLRTVQDIGGQWAGQITPPREES